jgi:hypothetical protein
MAVQLFGEGTDFAAGVFGVTALVVIGLYLLFHRIADSTKRRRSLGTADAIASAPIASVGAPPSQGASRRTAASSQAGMPEAATLESQLRDANHCLFMVLMDCCNMVSEVGEGSSGARSDAVAYAANIRQPGRNAMSNKQIADHAYQLAAELRPVSDPAMIAIRRVLTQLTTAERLGANLGGGGWPFEET